MGNEIRVGPGGEPFPEPKPVVQPVVDPLVQPSGEPTPELIPPPKNTEVPSDRPSPTGGPAPKAPAAKTPAAKVSTAVDDDMDTVKEALEAIEMSIIPVLDAVSKLRSIIG